MHKTGDLEVRVWLGVADDPTADILFETSFINRYIIDMFHSVLSVALRILRPIYMSAFGRQNKNSSKAIFTKDIRIMTKKLSKVEIRVARQALISQRS